MAGIAPGLAVDRDQILQRADRDRHQRVTGAAGEFERIRRARRGDIKFRPRLLRRPRQRGDVLEGMKLAAVRDVLSSQQQLDLLEAFAETGDGFVGRNTEAPEFVRQEGAGKADVEAAAGNGIEHGDLAGKFQRVVERRHHRAGDQPHFFGARRRRRQKHDRIGAIAAIALEIMLDRARVGVAERLSLLGDGEALARNTPRRFCRSAGNWGRTERRTACDPVFRHPEVRAERSSKDTAEAPGPSPFEGRFAATSG